MTWDTLEKKAWFSLGLCWNGLTRHGSSEWIIWHASSDDSHTQRFRFWKAFDTEILAANVSSWWLLPLSADLQQLSATVTWLSRTSWKMTGHRQRNWDPKLGPQSSKINAAGRQINGKIWTPRKAWKIKWLPTYHDDENQEALKKVHKQSWALIMFNKDLSIYPSNLI